jgi:hypothetical protein
VPVFLDPDERTLERHVLEDVLRSTSAALAAGSKWVRGEREHFPRKDEVADGSCPIPAGRVLARQPDFAVMEADKA